MSLCRCGPPSATPTLDVRSVSLPPSGMASRALTARLMITCSNCPTSALTAQRSRTCGTSRTTFSPIRRRSSTVRSESASPRSITCGRIVCVRDIAREPPDRLHLLLLIDLVLQRALLGGLERVDDGGLALALRLILDRG